LIEKDPKAILNAQHGLVQFEMLKSAYVTQFKSNPAFGRIILQDNEQTVAFGVISTLYAQDRLNPMADLTKKRTTKDERAMP